MDKLESDVLILLERSENLRDQLKRFVSHLESEQRVSGNISKRVEDAHYMIRNMDEIIKKHERILLNDGRGLSFRIDRLDTAQQSSRSNVTTWISVLSLLTSIAAIVIMMFK